MSQFFDRQRYRKSEVQGWLRSFCPDETVSSVVDISPEHLQAKNIRALLLDLDNTITPWKSYEVPQPIRVWLQSLKEAGIHMCFVSNTRRIKRLKWLSAHLEIPYVLGPMKPRRGLLIRALNHLNVEPEHAAIIGDQMFTDVWGGNRMQIYTIWVQPLNSREFIGTKVSRMAEKWIRRKLKPYGESHSDS